VNFTPDETQRAVAALAADVLGRGPAADAVAGPDGAGHPGTSPDGAGHLGTSDHGTGPDGAGYDEGRWKALGAAGLLALALPETLGGDGLGVVETAIVLTEVGRRAAPVPALATLALGVLPVVRWGSAAQQRSLLPEVAAGGRLLTAALREPSEPAPAQPRTEARPAGGGPVRVSGVKIGVPYAAAAHRILVPVTVAGGTAVALVDPAADGVALCRTPASGGAPEYTLRLDGAPAELLGGEAGAAAEDLYRLAVAGACAVGDGAVAGALALTSAHVGSRHQFGRPLAAFQAVAQQIAEVYVTARTLHLAAASACWRLDSGRDPGPHVDVAAHWLAEEAPAALARCHHLHGGLGVDATYPLHRYSSLVKDLARFVGGADHSLDALAARVGEA
jgi:alkylation response protein AidB-like acyl-CoA dehydrogenase